MATGSDLGKQSDVHDCTLQLMLTKEMHHHYSSAVLVSTSDYKGCSPQRHTRCKPRLLTL